MGILDKLTGKESKEEKLTETIKVSEANISTSDLEKAEEVIQDDPTGTKDEGPIGDPELKKTPDKAWFEEDVTEREQSPEGQLIKYVKLTRLKLDSQMQLIDVCLGTGSGAAKKTFLAKAWLGKVLEQLGNTNPYETKTPVTKANEIPPTAEVSTDTAGAIYAFKLLNKVEQVVSCRSAIAMIIDDIERLNFENIEVKDGRLVAIAKTQSYVNACEVRFALGYELSKLRK